MNLDQKLCNFFSGLLAGFVSVTLCNPLDITRTRLNIMNSPSHKSLKYTGFIHTMSTIFKQQGIKGFYIGYRTNIIAIPLFHSIFFPIYEYSKHLFHNNGYNKYLQYFLSTAFAGSICNILTNPIWVIRTRVMVQYLHKEDRQYTTPKPMKIMKQMIKEEGIQSLFKGLSASLLSVSNASVYFICYETLKEWLHVENNNNSNINTNTNNSINNNISIKDFSTLNIFLASTISKIISSSSTYPLIVIRTVLHDHKHSHNGFILQKKLTFLDVYKYIMKQNGISGFYSGLKPDLVRLIPSNAILFITYEYMKKVWKIYVNENKKQ